MSAAESPTTPAFGRTGHVDVDDLVDRRPEPGPSLDGDILAPVAKTTGLDALRAELTAEVTVETVTADVPTRPGYAVRFRCDVTYDELAAWRKRSADKTKPGHLDEVKLAAIIVANKAEAIVAHGEDITSDGEPVGFGHPVFLDLVGQGSPVAAVRHFYGRDGHVDAAAKLILSRSGFGDELPEDDERDPTKTSR